MSEKTNFWESGNIKKIVNNILGILDGLPINFAKHVLDEVEKEMFSRAIIQSEAKK